MRSAMLGCLISVTVAGCAGERIVGYSQNLGLDLGDLPVQEVVFNLENTIDARYHIPSRTTFGKGTVNTTDTESLGVTMPIHNISRNSGSVNANFGQYVDQFSMNVAPTVEGPALLKLRELYTWAVYGESTHFLPRELDKCKGWLFWQPLGASQSTSGVLSNFVPVAKGRKYELFTSSQKCFSDFVLATFGAFEQAKIAPAARQAEKGGLRNAPTVRRSTPSTSIPQRSPAVEPFTSGPSILLAPPAGGALR